VTIQKKNTLSSRDLCLHILNERLLHKLFLISGILILCSLSAPSNADQLSILLNGKAMHVNSEPGTDYNERNWGGGFQYDYGTRTSRWVPFVTISGFIDSYQKQSYYAGGGMLRRFPISRKMDHLHFDAGVVGFAMTRKDINDGRPFIGALPVFSLGTDKMALNITYVPDVDKRLAELWFIQLKVSAKSFW
jgi:hypothetical protein